MSGLFQHGYPAFMKAEKRLIKNGYKVVNPARLNTHGDSWQNCLRNDLSYIVKYCDSIALLRNWRHSKGGKLEVSVGVQLGFSFIDAINLKPIEITLEQKFKRRKI